jgi:hypothetical protein
MIVFGKFGIAFIIVLQILPDSCPGLAQDASFACSKIFSVPRSKAAQEPPDHRPTVLVKYPARHFAPRPQHHSHAYNDAQFRFSDESFQQQDDPTRPLFDAYRLIQCLM